MAANNHLITASISICSLLLLLLQTSATDQEQQHAPAATQKIISAVVVEGIVYCQKCQYSGSLTAAEPISYAAVNVLCRNSHHLVTFHKVYTADEHGYFYAKLDGFYGNPLQGCTVKLVSSPLQACNVPTDINSGPYGATLRFEHKVYKYPPYETVIYAAGPLAFRPSKCPQPFADDVHL
ncbi:Non-classical arabinogalactan protein 31 [Linum perenne]